MKSMSVFIRANAASPCLLSEPAFSLCPGELDVWKLQFIPVPEIGNAPFDVPFPSLRFPRCAAASPDYHITGARQMHLSFPPEKMIAAGDGALENGNYVKQPPWSHGDCTAYYRFIEGSAPVSLHSQIFLGTPNHDFSSCSYTKSKTNRITSRRA